MRCKEIIHFWICSPNSK